MMDELIESLKRIGLHDTASADPISLIAGRIALDAAIPRKKDWFVTRAKANLRRKGKAGKTGETIEGAVGVIGEGGRPEIPKETVSKEDSKGKNVGKGKEGLVKPISLSHNAHPHPNGKSEVVSRRPVGPNAATRYLQSKEIRDIISKNCSLIKTVDKDMIPGIERRVKRIYEGTSTPETLTRYLEDECDLAPHQAALIVRDQMQKYEAFCRAATLKKQGVKLVRWVHGGSHEPRPWHMGKAPHGLNGLVFDIDHPPIIDPETGERGLPGQLIGCQCHLEAVR